MNLNQGLIPLEDRLFKKGLHIGLPAIVILLSFDAFISYDTYSILIEIAAGIFFLINLYFLGKRNSSKSHRYMFSVVLVILVNLGWVMGGGISMLLSTIYFLSLCFILIINDNRIYWVIFLIAIINFGFLFSLEEFFSFNLAPDFEANKSGLGKRYMISFLLLLFGGYLIVFLKTNYNKERTNLNRVNELLNEKTIKIFNQNEALTTSKEKLDNTIEKLESQRQELIEIKETLEDKVQERTEDLSKVNDRLVAQNQQLEQYTYITSHNLRAPITQIKGLVHLLPLNEKFDDLTQETLRRLGESADNLEKVFTDLSTILRIEKSMHQPWEEVDFVEEISVVVESLKSSIREKNIQVIQPAIDYFVVNAMRPYVHSIFHNIIENAVKYSDGSKTDSFVKIEISETHKFYLVSINDNGIGIDMDMASGKVFQMYQRFNSTHPGQGFGLFLVKTQIESMSGEVELISILGRGTTFNLYFPKR